MFHVGQYELVSPLGEGGMAVVWRARDRKTGEPAAVKVVMASHASDARYMRAFFSEARAHAGLVHPNIVRLLDYGHVRSDDFTPDTIELGQPYLVMELANGSVADLFPVRSFKVLLEVVLPILDALAYSHARGVIHRDLKPENVLLVGEEGAREVKLTDFGIARPLHLEERRESDPQSRIAGTPGYMPPEQLRGEEAHFGPWTDLYALGAMAYEMATGRLPFEAESLLEMAQLHINEPLPLLEPKFNVPAAFPGWVSRMMAKHPENRFRHAADAAFSLMHILTDFEPEESEAEDVRTLEMITHGMGTLSGLISDAAFGATLESSDDLLASAMTLDQSALARTMDSGDASRLRNRPAPSREMPGLLDADAAAIVPPIEVIRPPVPARWQMVEHDGSAPSVGLGLFALREPPLVGFEGQRTALWHSLSGTSRGFQPAMVLLRGAGAAPVRELADWFVTRAAEVGAATSIHVFHTRAGGPREGPAGLIEHLLQVWAVPSRAVETRVRDVLRPHLEAEILEAETGFLAGEMLKIRGVDVERRGARTDRDLFRLLVPLLRRRASERPLILWLQNLHWGARARDLAELLLNADGLRVLILGTVADEEVDEAARMGLKRLQAHEHCQTHEVPNYGQTDHVRLIDSMLSLEPASREAVVTLSSENPHIAHALLADLIAADRLTDAPGGWTIDSPDQLPASVMEFFDNATDRLLGQFDERESAEYALELAATLGVVPDPVELDAVLRAGTVSAPAELLGRLREAGLVGVNDRGWWFLHEEMRETLRVRSKQAGRQARWSRLCAEVTTANAVKGENPDRWRRVAQYHIDAGEPLEALEPLRHAASAYLQSDPVRARTAMAMRGELIESADAPTSATVDQLVMESLLCRTEGDASAAVEAAEAAAELAKECGYRLGLARALRQLGNLRVRAGDAVGGLTMLEKSAALYEEHGSAVDHANTLLLSGFAAYRLGAFDRAEAQYRQAIGALEATDGNEHRIADVLAYLAGLLTAIGREAEAVGNAERAFEMARTCGAARTAARALNILGDIARFAEDYELAESRYQDVLRWTALNRDAGRHVATLNLALLMIGRGEFERARPFLQSADDHLGKAGVGIAHSIIALARGLCSLADGDLDDANWQLDEAERATGPHSVDKDLAWLYEVGVALAERVGAAAIASRLETASREQRLRLGT